MVSVSSQKKMMLNKKKIVAMTDSLMDCFLILIKKAIGDDSTISPHIPIPKAKNQTGVK